MRRATPRERSLLIVARRRWQPYQLPGGIPAKRRLRPEQFNPHQLAIGTMIELEHTDDAAVALEIAMAHLAESPRYYAMLEQMEQRL